MLELVKLMNLFSKKTNFILGKIVPCNGISMAKQCVCIPDHDHPYDAFLAGILLSMCSKTDQSILPYLKE
jgi:hypothetical protein